MKECKILKREHNQGKKNERDANTVSTKGEVVLVCDDGCVSLATQDCSWVIDSSASFHVTARSDYLTSYIAGDFGNVRMRNSGASNIVGIGDICLETSLGSKLILKDVRHVPDIHLNLISTGRLDDEGFTNWFGESKWRLTNGSEAKLHKGEINAVLKDVSIDLWH